MSAALSVGFFLITFRIARLLFFLGSLRSEFVIAFFAIWSLFCSRAVWLNFYMNSVPHNRAQHSQCYVVSMLLILNAHIRQFNCRNSGNGKLLCIDVGLCIDSLTGLTANWS